MKFKFFAQSFVKTLLLCSLLGTIYGWKRKDKYKKGIRMYNVRDPVNMRITDRWFEEHPNFSNYIDIIPSTDQSDDEKDMTLYAGFGVSKPKPWRKDDSKSRLLNKNCEISVDPNDPNKQPLPQVRTRDDSPGMENINQSGCGISEVNSARIVNGDNAEPGAYPWTVAILKSGDAWCGGSIINERWILTASHCFMNDQNPRLYAIRVGTINRNSGTTYKVDKVIIHERFHLDNMFNSDIALMRVNKVIIMSKLVRPVCLPVRAYEEVKVSTLLVVGWGQTSYENRDLPTILQEVTLNRINITDCALRYKPKKNTIYFSQVCTWNEGKDACKGDSGAPAIEWRKNAAYIVGIVSYGSTCADENPGVYTKVSYFIDWIFRRLESDDSAVRRVTTTTESPEYEYYD